MRFPAIRKIGEEGIAAARIRGASVAIVTFGGCKRGVVNFIITFGRHPRGGDDQGRVPGPGKAGIPAPERVSGLAANAGEARSEGDIAARREGDDEGDSFLLRPLAVAALTAGREVGDGKGITRHPEG